MPRSPCWNRNNKDTLQAYFDKLIAEGKTLVPIDHNTIKACCVTHFSNCQFHNFKRLYCRKAAQYDRVRASQQAGKFKIILLFVVSNIY